MTATAMDWEWAPDDLEYMFATSSLVNPTRDALMVAGSPISAPDHNALISQLLVMRDAIARPNAAGLGALWNTSTQSLNAGAYLSVTYHGGVAAQAGTAVPVVGLFPPTDLTGDRSTLYRAITQYIRRLSRWTESGTVAAGSAPRLLVGVAGAGAEAAVVLRGDGVASFGVKEDAPTIAAWPALSAGLTVYAAQLLEAQWARAVVTQDSGGAFARAAPIITALAREYDDEQATARRTAGIIGGIVAAVAVAGAAVMKKDAWRPFVGKAFKRRGRRG